MIGTSQDFEGGSGVPEFVYDEASGSYYMKPAGAEHWISMRETQLRRELKSAPHCLADKPNAMLQQTISPLDAKIREIEQGMNGNRRVKFACLLAGWKAGVHEMGPELVLVTRSPKLIVPKKGEWPMLARVIEQLFVGEDDGIKIDQRDHYFCWLRRLLQALYSGVPAKNLWMCIAGEPDSGKTLQGRILKALTGGNEGKPYKWLIDEEEFNQELFEATLQTVDDENAKTHIEARKALAAKAKQVVKVGDMRLRGMNKNGIVMQPNWALVSLLNLQAESLLVMPPITSDIADAILMFKGYKKKPTAEEIAARCKTMPMPTDTPIEEAAFWAVLRGEFSAFVWWLLEEYQPPSPISGGRFGVRAWQHPQILEELQHFSPHVRLWQLIERSGVVWRKSVGGESVDVPASWEECDTWEGSASDLEHLLKSESSKLYRSEKDKEVKQANWLGQQLKAAQEQWGDEVAQLKRGTKDGKSQRVWVLHRRQDLAE